MPAPPPPAPTIRSSGWRLTLASGIEPTWRGRDLVEVLLEGHITPRPAHRSDRVTIRGGTGHRDLTAIAAVKGEELHVIAIRSAREQR